MWVYGLIANFQPGHQETWVDYALDWALAYADTKPRGKHTA
ncbi:hypothetical protein [Mycolicibacterium tusciae]|nr:hypothetical protein [Mycolicibacterium tusciae]